jgi:ornithine racemase
MTTPRIEISIDKIAKNAKKLKSLYASKGIQLFGVTKAVCGDIGVANGIVESGITVIADSRMANIQKMRKAGVSAQFVLLRTPFLSQAKSVIKYVDISFNSELSVIKRLSKFAVKNGSIHKIILMVELGDLREGIMPADLEDVVEEMLELKGIKIVGIGTNLACFGGIKPNIANMEQLSKLANAIEKKFKLTLQFVSGGNSANYEWFNSTDDVGKINNLRVGESIYLGCETLHRESIPDLFTDAFTLVAEVIELKMKPSIPYGEICQNAFGEVPKFQNLGPIRRAILGIGLQDVVVSGLTPRLDIDILGSSSDHIILNAKNVSLTVGDEVEFDLNYGALLSAMTSPYVEKKYINDL